MSHRSVDEIVSEMLAGAAPPAAESSARAAQALDPDYWRQLLGDAGLTADGSEDLREEMADGIDHRTVADRFAVDGYFEVDAMFPPGRIERMRAIVDAVRARDWHPVFAFVYDEFWAVCRAPTLVALLDALLGAGFRQTPKAWCHYVESSHGARGWSPHIDDAPARRKVTLWIALTDATLDNGCIFVVPKPHVPGELLANWNAAAAIDRAHVYSLLHGVRPLPVRSGSALGWGMGLVHWGSIARCTGVPRVSLSFDFISASEAPASDEQPLLPIHTLPPFADRLAFIGQNIVDYQKFEIALTRYTDLAMRLAPRASANSPDV